MQHEEPGEIAAVRLQPESTGDIGHPGSLRSDHGDAIARFLKSVCAGKADHAGADNGHNGSCGHRSSKVRLVADGNRPLDAGCRRDSQSGLHRSRNRIISGGHAETSPRVVQALTAIGHRGAGSDDLVGRDGSGQIGSLGGPPRQMVLERRTVPVRKLGRTRNGVRVCDQHQSVALDHTYRLRLARAWLPSPSRARWVR